MITRVLSYSDSRFRRYTGVTRLVFDVMVAVLKSHEEEFKKVDGRPLKLSYEELVLMLLEYYRENRTFFHLGTTYGLSESNVHRHITKIEDILMASDYFRLDGNRILVDNKQVKRIVVDVTECPAQRPKKKERTEDP